MWYGGTDLPGSVSYITLRGVGLHVGVGGTVRYTRQDPMHGRGASAGLKVWSSRKACRAEFRRLYNNIQRWC